MKSDIFASCVLFRGMTEREMEQMLDFFHAEEKNFEKGAAILLAGTPTERMGIVLEGSATIERNDLWGNRAILSLVSKGQLFAETYALLKDEPLLVDVVANERCRVLFLRVPPASQLISLQNTRDSQESWVMKYMSNLLAVSAHKNLQLSGRSFHTAPKTIRGRVMSYLTSYSLQTRANAFDIPFDRQQLADYLNLERSALSKELGKMQREGLIRVRKNHFEIISNIMP